MHATAVALYVRGAWRAALLRGPSGAGKSDLALRAIAAGWRLVADDRVILWASGGRLFARAPARLSGLIEARTLGVEPRPALAFAEVVLVVELAGPTEDLDRIPQPRRVRLEGVGVRRIALKPLEASAPAKMTLALQAATLGAGPEGAYQPAFADEA